MNQKQLDELKTQSKYVELLLLKKDFSGAALATRKMRSSCDHRNLDGTPAGYSTYIGVNFCSICGESD